MSNSFRNVSGTYVPTEGDGATLTLAGGFYTYTSRDGVVARFAGNTGYAYSFYHGELGRLGSIKYPDGTTITVSMKVQLYCPGGYDEFGTCLSQRYYVSRVDRKEHTSELQSLMRISYAVFCLQKKTKKKRNTTTDYSLNR